MGDKGGEDDLACGGTYSDEEDKGEDFGRVNKGDEDDGGFASDREDEGFRAELRRGAFILACCNTAADLDSS